MSCALGIILSMLFFVIPGEAEEFSNARAGNQSRIRIYDQAFFHGAVPAEYLDEKVGPAPEQLREFMTVLPGVLYRGGGPGGTRPLSAQALHSLCEAGFSLAVYTYTEGYSDPGPISCVNKYTQRGNTLRYIAGDTLDQRFKARVLEKVHDVILNPEMGPVFVHCWNGFHASGEIAAIALRQFCGWSGPAASAYWLRNADGAPMISRVRKYTPASTLEIPAELREQLCRQEN